MVCAQEWTETANQVEVANVADDLPGGALEEGVSMGAGREYADELRL